MSDARQSVVRWQLEYSELSDAEWSSIEQLFEASEGTLNTFTFLDPTDNLMLWSEDWTQSVWRADPLIALSCGAEDPLGENGAMQIVNNAQATQQIVQAIAGASRLEYCFSVFLRSDFPATVQLVMSTDGQQQLTAFPTSSAWSRAIAAGSFSVQQDGMSFGLQLPAGATVSAFGAQVEAQVTAGSYKKTTNLAGVYPNTRFDSDVLSRKATGLNQNAGTVALVSNFS